MPCRQGRRDLAVCHARPVRRANHWRAMAPWASWKARSVGSHDELLSNGGLYAQLVRTQIVSASGESARG